MHPHDIRFPRFHSGSSSSLCLVMLAITFMLMTPTTCTPASTSLTLHTRSQTQSTSPHESWKTTDKKVRWKASQTALIICDMWDDHWCKSAASRVVELAPRMNEVIQSARARGVLIIHAPSSVTSFYSNSPQRLRAQSAPFHKTIKPLTTAERWGTTWCWHDSKIEGTLPIDDSDMGCSCPTPCTIREAWTRQIASLEIAPQDFITDHGQETFNLLAQNGIKNVLIMGVHLNMCVLGRPFGIRQLVTQGKNVVLIRDLTDTMYNPKRSPHVDHFTGTDLVISHVEQHWCPTIDSTDLIGGKPFRFRDDQR